MSQPQQLDLHQLLHSDLVRKSPALSYLNQKDVKVPMSDVTHEKILRIQKDLFKKSKVNTFNIGKKNWKQEQLQFLFFIIDKLCLTLQSPLQMLNQEHWEKVAYLFPGRQQADCKYKALSLKKYSLSEFPWSQQQQKAFVRIIEEEGLRWDKVAKKLHEQARNTQRRIFRNSKQCREHYLCFLNPNMKKGPWSQDQDYKLVNLYLKFGRKWSKMSRAIKGRNENAIKNRFFLLVQNKFKSMKSSSQNLLDEYIEQTQRIKYAYQARLGKQKCQYLETGLLDSQMAQQSQQNQVKLQEEAITPRQRKVSIVLHEKSKNAKTSVKKQHECKQQQCMGSQQFLDFLTF